MGQERRSTLCVVYGVLAGMLSAMAAVAPGYWGAFASGLASAAALVAVIGDPLCRWLDRRG